MELIFIDTETGGLTPDKASLLSIGVVIWEQGTISASTEILVKEDNIIASEEALAITKIDLEKHSKEAIYTKEGLEHLISFCKRNTQTTKPWIIAGHNTLFDITFLKYSFKKYKLDYSKYFSHRTVDTSSILRFLYCSGYFSEDISSSDKAFKHFNIQIKKRHTALGDVLATAQLFNELIKIIKVKPK